MCEREEGEISEMRRREKETMLLCCASVGFFFLFFFFFYGNKTETVSFFFVFGDFESCGKNLKSKACSVSSLSLSLSLPVLNKEKSELIINQRLLVISLYQDFFFFFF